MHDMTRNMFVLNVIPRHILSIMPILTSIPTTCTLYTASRKSDGEGFGEEGGRGGGRPATASPG